MISYKTLIVLTVIFDITCGLRYWKECRGILRKFGFRPGFPLYNMNFLLQFDDETEYIKYMNKMIKLDCDTNMTLPKKVVFTTLETQADLTSISSDDKKIDSPEDKNIDILEDNKEKLPEHFKAAKENNDDLEEVIRTPLEYCTLSIKELELGKSTQQLYFCFLIVNNNL
ncbi:uncharacterized protein LOC100571823 isoform X2 [Acyrthosiphon pisum]|uniref:Uncharacterized protein n=1 Tax=Acyrthosiphon pisum TaxID=7029 RepID=A0A8R2JQ33_ACYPI|nr:uncharacterized protein LOC100571823 isoform X2 [Acyrthosiphon pisum]